MKLLEQGLNTAGFKRQRVIIELWHAPFFERPRQTDYQQIPSVYLADLQSRSPEHALTCDCESSCQQALRHSHVQAAMGQPPRLKLRHPLPEAPCQRLASNHCPHSILLSPFFSASLISLLFSPTQIPLRRHRLLLLIFVSSCLERLP